MLARRRDKNESMMLLFALDSAAFAPPSVACLPAASLVVEAMMICCPHRPFLSPSAAARVSKSLAGASHAKVSGALRSQSARVRCRSELERILVRRQQRAGG